MVTPPNWEITKDRCDSVLSVCSANVAGVMPLSCGGRYTAADNTASASMIVEKRRVFNVVHIDLLISFDTEARTIIIRIKS